MCVFPGSTAVDSRTVTIVPERRAMAPVQASHYVDGVVIPEDPVAFPGDGIIPQVLQGPEYRELYQRRYPAIRTRHGETPLPRVSTYNFRIPTTNGSAASLAYLRTVHRRQARAYKVNASVGAFIVHKTSGRIRYFHASSNNYRLLAEPALVTEAGHLSAITQLVDQVSWTEHVASLRPDSAWRVVCVTDVLYTLYHDGAKPIMGSSKTRRLRGVANRGAIRETTESREDGIVPQPPVCLQVYRLAGRPARSRGHRREGRGLFPQMVGPSPTRGAVRGGNSRRAGVRGACVFGGIPRVHPGRYGSA